MPRSAGVDLPRDKRVEIGLTHIHGMGRSRNNQILNAILVDPDVRVTIAGRRRARAKK